MRRPLPLPSNEAGTDPGRPDLGHPGPGIWMIDGDSLVTVERFDVGRSIVLVPAEEVLLLAVDLPIANPRRRLDALPFAIEDRIAQPLGAVHTAIGEALGPQRWLAAVVDEARMANWTALLLDAGLEHAALVPDVLGLPVPPIAAWSLAIAGGRALVRVEDGTGFALPIAHLGAAWIAAGRPRLISFQDAPPSDLEFEAAAHEADMLADRLARPALDLRQGRHAVRRRAVPPIWRRIALVAAAGALAHAAIAGVDTVTLQHQASTKAEAMRALIQQAMPGASIGDDVAVSAADMLPAGGSALSNFLPLFSQVGVALKPLGPAVRLKTLSYDARAGTMSIEVEAATIEALQQVGSALSAAGLPTQAGAASSTDGKATGAFLIGRAA